MASDQQATEQAATPQAKPDNRLRLTIDDFTQLGLLTPEEIANKTEVSRVIAVENADVPTAGSVSEYESVTSPKGFRTEFKTVAENAGQTIKEITIEADIYTAIPEMEVKGWPVLKWFWPTLEEKEPVTYFTLTATERSRTVDGNKNTTRSLKICTIQDPGNPDSFIVDNGTLKLVEEVRQYQKAVGDRMEKIAEHPNLSVKEVVLGAPSAQ